VIHLVATVAIPELQTIAALETVACAELTAKQELRTRRLARCHARPASARRGCQSQYSDDFVPMR
jgi:hypothetical protein